MELKNEDEVEPNEKKNWITTCGKESKCLMF